MIADAPPPVKRLPRQLSRDQTFAGYFARTFASCASKWHLAVMADAQWESKLEETFKTGVQRYGEGERNADNMFTTKDKAFLGTIGCTAQELFDFVEDYCEFGVPDLATTLELAAIRRRYFVEVQHGIPSQFHIDPQELPPKYEELEGFRWLPRIIAKARAKLRGELDPTTMYGCGGDRAFVESIGMTTPQFLRLVWEAGEDDQRILDGVKGALAGVT